MTFRSVFQFSASVAVGLFLVACSASDIPQPADSVTRAQAMQIARAYVELQWQGAPRLIMHGQDPDGMRVDTPDIAASSTLGDTMWWTNGTNTGMPYKWGGFDTPAQFRNRIATDKIVYAGDYASPQKVKGGDAVVSRYAAGIDCSGFVSRCWRLERPYSTRELATLCTPLQDFGELQAGDILLKPGVHVILFVKWANEQKTKFYAYESAGSPTWKCHCAHFTLSELKKIGYSAWRYKHIR